VRLTSRVVRDVFDRAGQRTDGFSLAHAGPSVADQVARMVSEVRRPQQVVVRAAKRWGPHQPGSLVATDLEMARWALGRGYAEAV
jgi:hypothetical protein